MKTVAALLAFLCSLPLVLAATFDIGWDLRPASEGVTAYVVYMGPTNAAVRIASSATNKVTLTAGDGAYRLTVTSTNAIDESLPSQPLYVVVTGTNVIAVTNRPGAPLNIQLR